jgi:lysophospholipase L1-like esterase
LVAFTAAGTLPAAAGSGTVWYVALGDSYAAGQGAPPYVNEACKRSDNGYPALLDANGRIRLVANEACTGAKISDVIDPQLSALNPGRTKLVTLTVGANNLDVSGVARTCLTGTLEDCQTAIGVARAMLPVKCEGPSELGDLLTNLYTQLADAAPHALVVVTGYPLLFEAPPSGDPREAINVATALLNCAIADAAAEAAHATGVKFLYVDVTDAFAGHGIGSAVPFINSSGQTLFTRMPQATLPMSTPSRPNCRMHGWTNKRRWPEVLRPPDLTIGRVESLVISSRLSAVCLPFPEIYSQAERGFKRHPQISHRPDDPSWRPHPHDKDTLSGSERTSRWRHRHTSRVTRGLK